MGYAWEDLREKIIRMLDDERDGSITPTWSDDELRDYANFGLAALASHTAETKSFEYTATEETSYIQLPSDLIDIGPVWYPNRQLVNPLNLRPGLAFATPTPTTSSLPVAYYEWPDGVLNLTRSLSTGQQLRVFYWGNWTEIEEDADPIKIPVWAREAVVWYCVSMAMTKPGVLAAQLGEWKTKRDSGNPEDNPADVYAKSALQRYYDILAMHPTQDRNGWKSQVS